MSLIRILAAEVRALKPGEHLRVDRYYFRHEPEFEHNGARWRPEEQVLESIVGAAYEFSIETDPVTGDTIFIRREPCQTGTRRYVSPDRRDRFTLCPDGLYRPKGSA